MLRLDNPFSSAAVVATTFPLNVPSFGNAPDPPAGTIFNRRLHDAAKIGAVPYERLLENVLSRLILGG